MRDIQTVFETTYADDIDGAIDWCYNRYMKEFSNTFVHVREIYNNMTDTTKLTDADIEWVITQLPLELFEVSENLNNLRLGCEIIKLKNKELKTSIRSEIDSSIRAAGHDEIYDSYGNVSDINSAVQDRMMEYELVLKVHSSTVSMVENQISFCREFIRGCKKIWDGRRRTEAVNPISEVIPEDKNKLDLPEYPGV